jgi:hypothetical protein
VNSQENIIGVHALFEKLEIESPGDIDEKQTAVNIQKVDTMKNAFNIITLVLICSLILSLFIPPHKAKKDVEGCVTSNI